MRRLGFLLLATLALGAAAGCTGEGSPDDGVVANVQASLEVASVEQLDAFDKLAVTTHRAWTWIQHADTKTPKHLSAPRVGSSILGAKADVVAATLAVLAENKALFRLHDPMLELGAPRAHVDALGMRHARFQQMTHGVPVSGAEMAAHYDAEGRIASIDATYIPDLQDLDVNPTLLETDARARAIADVVARTVASENELEAQPGVLVVYAPGQGQVAKLAYEFTVDAMAAETPAIWKTTIDAKTGDVLHTFDNLQTVAGKGTGVLGDTKSFEVSGTSGKFTMVDASSKFQVQTLTAAGKKSAGTVISSGNSYIWDESVIGAGAAVDAHFNAEIVGRYYLQKHVRSGIDGAGGSLVSTVHWGAAYDNAAWNGTGMIYGDGGDVFYPTSVSLDVVGHEFTHGVTERSSALLYEGQPGALNEAVSDIFGAFIEHFAAPDDTKNWTIGEKALKAGGALRDMKDPGSVELAQPAHYSQYLQTQQDKGGVHANSGIINNAAYLMTAGGVNPVSGIEVAKGIGWEKSEQLWYRANTEYFLKNTDFNQAAHALLQAAKDLKLTTDETHAVETALLATGIVSEEELATATATDGSSGLKKTRRLVITQSSTCSASAASALGSGHSSLGAYGVCAALVGLAWKRRRKS